MPEGYRHLTCEQRCQIYALLQSGHSQAHIARAIGVDPSTISRELVRNTGARGYRFKQAHEKASQRRKEASDKPPKMTPDLVELIEEKLTQEQWSPDQISGRLAKDVLGRVLHFAIRRGRPIGPSGPRFPWSRPWEARRPHDAIVDQQAECNDKRAWKYLYQNHPEASFEIKRLAMGSVESGIVEVEISGPDADRLLALGDEVRSLFRRAPGIRENDDDWGNKVIKVVVDINQDRVRRLGITSEEITQMLKTYFTGSAVSTYREGDNTIPIVLRAGAETHQSVEGLTSATFAHNGALVSLAQIATLRTGLDFSRIRRKNQERTIIVSGRSASSTAGELLSFIQPGLRALDLGGDYHVDIGGEIQKSAETNGKLAAGIPAALVIMVLAIILQFNSLRRMLLTFLTIPLILVGIPYGLLATGQPLSFFGTLGIISLAGIIINNAIVLIDQIDIERSHADLRDAIIAASQKRQRPILLTSATTVLGLAPMAVAGGALWQPMAVLIMSGVAVASLLTLLFVPAGYFVLCRFDRATDGVVSDVHHEPAVEKLASQLTL